MQVLLSRYDFLSLFYQVTQQTYKERSSAFFWLHKACVHQVLHFDSFSNDVVVFIYLGDGPPTVTTGVWFYMWLVSFLVLVFHCPFFLFGIFYVIFVFLRFCFVCWCILMLFVFMCAGVFLSSKDVAKLTGTNTMSRSMNLTPELADLVRKLPHPMPDPEAFKVPS
jgi:hypothetical protein